MNVKPLPVPGTASPPRSPPMQYRNDMELLLNIVPSSPRPTAGHGMGEVRTPAPPDYRTNNGSISELGHNDLLRGPSLQHVRSATFPARNNPFGLHPESSVSQEGNTGANLQRANTEVLRARREEARVNEWPGAPASIAASSQGSHGEEPRLLKMTFNNKSVITRCHMEYKDVEKAARRTFPIHGEAKVRFSAVVPSFGDGKHDIDALVWPTMRTEIAEMWVREDWSATQRKVRLYHPMTFSNMEVEVNGTSTIKDLKEMVLEQYAYGKLGTPGTFGVGPSASTTGRLVGLKNIRIEPAIWKFWDVRALKSTRLVDGGSYSYSFQSEDQ